jgi:phospholipid/cholesterol/gamma-HCH transport system permease protein
MERVTFDRGDAGSLIVRLAGDWQIRDGIPGHDGVDPALDGVARVRVDGSAVGAWDSSLASWVLVLAEACRARGTPLDLSGLPAGPERKGTGKDERRTGFIERLGQSTIQAGRDIGDTVGFIGEAARAFALLFTRRARFRGSDLALLIQECGAEALPIVTVISLLMGLILAFVGAVQLAQFGADIYVANLVVIAMAREMAAVMTAIVLAGRTGAAFAAQIGAMQGNEEIDALQTLGISAMEFLVLPRMLALILMTPLLCIYANLMGVLGGLIVAMGMLDVSVNGYLLQTQGAASLGDFAIGIGKSAIFGIIVAVSGCLQGIKAGRSAAAVGQATTTAVVMGILFIIVADGIFAVLFNILGW